MILQLTSDQCSSYWEDIKNAVISSIPEFADTQQEGLNQVLSNLLSGLAQAWVLLDGFNITAMAVTYIQEEPLTGVKNLLIYALVGYGNIPSELWTEGIASLQVFAREQGCKKIIAYSKVPRVLEIAKAINCDCETRLLQWEV